jgi:hypothetical protein
MQLDYDNSPLSDDSRVSSSLFSNPYSTMCSNPSSLSLIEPLETIGLIRYQSFPSPVEGRSPTLPSFRVPKYGYYNIEGVSPLASEQKSEASPARVGTASIMRKSTIFRAFLQCLISFMGVSVSVGCTVCGVRCVVCGVRCAVCGV